MQVFICTFQENKLVPAKLPRKKQFWDLVSSCLETEPAGLLYFYPDLSSCCMGMFFQNRSGQGDFRGDEKHSRGAWRQGDDHPVNSSRFSTGIYIYVTLYFLNDCFTYFTWKRS